MLFSQWSWCNRTLSYHVHLFSAFLYFTVFILLLCFCIIINFYPKRPKITKKKKKLISSPSTWENIFFFMGDGNLIKEKEPTQPYKNERSNSIACLKSAQQRSPAIEIPPPIPPLPVNYQRSDGEVEVCSKFAMEVNLFILNVNR